MYIHHTHTENIEVLLPNDQFVSMELYCII